MIEETNRGRLLEVELGTQKLLWQFLNKSRNSNTVYMLNWSRRINPDFINKEFTSELKKCI